VQDVKVTNASLPISGSVSVSNFPAAATGVTDFFSQEFFPFNSEQVLHIDISKYKRVRIRVTVNVSGTVDFFYGTDAGVSGDFSVDAGNVHTELLPEVAGTTLELDLEDPDGEQVFVDVYGSN
jgi:hypothetical protein